MATPFNFSGQVVIVTGAAGNLGRAVVTAFAEAGALLVPVDHRLGRLAAAFPWLAEGPHLLAEGVDAANPEDAEHLVAQVLGRFGRVDALVNAAGGFAGGKPVHEGALDEWEQMLRLNLQTALVMSRAITPAMLAQGHGRIIHVGSKSGVQGSANVAAYAAAKSALATLAESQAAELKNKGITVNIVLPSTIDTPENRQAMPKADPAKWVRPQSLAGVILFLASELAADITGAAIPVYGRV